MTTGGSRPGLRLDQTTVVLLVVSVLFALAYLDLRGRIDALRLDMARTESAPVVRSGDPAGASVLTAPPQPAEPPWSCEGSIASEMVAQVLSRHGREVFACQSERSDPGVAGVVEVDVRVGASGSATGVRFAGTLREASLERCIRNAIAEWRFPPPVHGECAVVHLPFALGAPP